MKPVTIVAIALSEGGLLPLQQFFDYTPLDATAYVILTHLPPDSISMLEEMLQKHSSLQITEARSGALIASNMVYVLEQSRFLTIQRNQLIVSRVTANSITYTADIFLTSLAKNKLSKIAVVLLSGKGHDGTRGIAAIKAANGLVIVQEPATSQFSQIPGSAIKTGFVDYILTPAEMPALLTKWTENKFLPVPHRGATASARAGHRQQLLRQLGLSLKEIRLKKQITQQQLASQAGMQKASVSRIESGSSNLTIVSLYRLAGALGIQVADLF